MIETASARLRSAGTACRPAKAALKGPATGDLEADRNVDGSAGEVNTESEQQLALRRQRTTFDFELEERAELQRELNALRALQMEQMKRDDEIVRKWIETI